MDYSRWGGAYLLQENFTWGLIRGGCLFEGGGLIEALWYTIIVDLCSAN